MLVKYCAVCIALITALCAFSCTPAPTRDITGKYLKVRCDHEGDPPNAYLIIEKEQRYEGSYKITVYDTIGENVHDPILYGFNGENLIFHGQKMVLFTNDFNTIWHEASKCEYKK